MPLMRLNPSPLALRVALSLGAAAACEPALAQGAHDEAPGPETEGAAAARFVMLGVVIDGMTAFQVADLRDIYQPYLGREVGNDELALIAQRITDRYRARGYFLSRALVPPQDASGIARIDVVEGRISEARIEGNGEAAASAYFHGLGEEPIATIRDLQRRIALAGDVPGLEVHARMEPLAEDPHQHRLIVEATQTRFQARATFDNRGVPDETSLQAYGGLAFNSFARPGDQASASFFTTPLDPRQFSYLEAAYGVTSAEHGAVRASVSASHSSQQAHGQSPDLGDGVGIAITYEYPIVRQHGAGLWLGAAFDARHQERDWTTAGFVDELRVARVSLRGFLDDGGHSTSVFVRGSFGLPILGASETSLTRRSRPGADATFSSVQISGSHYAELGRHFGIYGAVAGQWSRDTLLNEEQFAVGGTPFGRAFGFGEMLGDQAIAGELEFRGGVQSDGLISFSQAYVFVDGARTWSMNAASGDIASAGAGLRLTFSNGMVAGWELARPIASTADDSSDWRQFFTLSTSTRR